MNSLHQYEEIICILYQPHKSKTAVCLFRTNLGREFFIYRDAYIFCDQFNHTFREPLLGIQNLRNTELTSDKY